MSSPNRSELTDEELRRFSSIMVKKALREKKIKEEEGCFTVTKIKLNGEFEVENVTKEQMEKLKERQKKNPFYETRDL